MEEAPREVNHEPTTFDQEMTGVQQPYKVCVVQKIASIDSRLQKRWLVSRDEDIVIFLNPSFDKELPRLR